MGAVDISMLTKLPMRGFSIPNSKKGFKFSILISDSVPHIPNKKKKRVIITNMALVLEMVSIPLFIVYKIMSIKIIMIKISGVSDKY